MRQTPLEEDVRANMKGAFPFLADVVSQSIRATADREAHDLSLGFPHIINCRATDVWRYAASIFTTRAHELPGLKVNPVMGTISLEYDNKYDLWLRLVDASLTPAFNRTDGSEARLNNGTLAGFKLPTLVLGYRFNATAQDLGSLNLICTGRKGKKLWAINLLHDESTGTLPFQVAPPVTGPTAPVREIEVKKELKKRVLKVGNGDGAPDQG